MPAKAQAKAPPTMPVGEMIDRLWSVREDIRALEAQAKVLEEEYDALEERVKHALDEQKLDAGRGDKATASIIEAEVPKLQDWDRFVTWVRRTGNYQLFERRVAVNAWREVCAKTKRVPSGTVPFVKRKLSLTTLAAKGV